MISELLLWNSSLVWGVDVIWLSVISVRVSVFV